MLFWIWVFVMLMHVLQRLGGRNAIAALLSRAAIVGANFAVMLGLTFTLGMAVFGELVFLWGQALVISTVVSCGGPLLVLRNMSDGRGMRGTQVAWLAMVLPAIICGLIWFCAMALWPQTHWLAVIISAFSINFLSCLASVMRALGSVQMSMILRDAGPFVALGIAGIARATEEPAAIVIGATLVVALMASAALLWCFLHHVPQNKNNANNQLGWTWSLWGTQVLGMVLAQIDLLLGGLLLPAQDLGLYAVLRRVANVVALPVSVATWVSAKPIAAAGGARDTVAMQAASAHGSQIAWYTGFGLAIVCFAGLGIASAWTQDIVTGIVASAFAVLVMGALVQAFFASGLTVATLGNQARLSAVSRGLSILLYMGAATALGGTLTPFTNAMCYAIAITLGSLLVWWGVWRRFGIDTSAFVLWTSEAVKWRTS